MSTRPGAAWRAWVPGGLLAAAALHSLLALALMLRTPAASEQGVLFGLSPARTAIAALFLVAAGGFTLLLFRVHLGQSAAFAARLGSSLHRPRNWGIAFFTAIFILALSAQVYLAAPGLEEPVALAYSVRMQPLLFWLGGLAILSALGLLAFPPSGSYLQVTNLKFYLWVAAAYAVLLIGWRWVVATQMARESIQTGWNELGIPILALQILAAWLAAVGLLALTSYRRGRLGNLRELMLGRPLAADLAIAALIWLLTLAVWTPIPIQPSWFVSEPLPPNFELYPNSDALTYDLSAQTVLVGEGMWFTNLRIVRRPMHALLLTILHAIGGQDYERVIFLQLVVLALIPPAAYWIAKSLHSRLAGMLIAGVLIFREANAISLAETITSSHAKLYMADLPATLAVLLFCIAALVWLRAYERRKLTGVLCGGLLAVAILIRPEMGGLLFAIALLLLIQSGWKFGAWIRNLGFPLLGMLLVITPWVVRNWSLTGLVFLDSPSFRMEMLSQRYEKYETQLDEIFQPEATPQAAPDAPVTSATPSPAETAPAESPPSFETTAPELASEDIPYLGYVWKTAGAVIDFARRNNASISRFIAANLLHSHMQLFLKLPTTLRLPDSLMSYSGHGSTQQLWQDCCSLNGYVRRLPYWRKWDGVIPAESFVPLALNLGLVGLGLGAAWSKFRWLGLLPLSLSSVHLLINAVFRNSGGRFILPVDWVSPLYFSIGLAAVTIWLFSLIKERDLSNLPLARPVYADPPHESGGRGLFRRPRFYLLCLGLLFLGGLPPLTEVAFRPVYDNATQVRMLASFLDSNLLDAQERIRLEDFLEQGASAVAGRALYPRYYRAGQSQPGGDTPLGAQPFNRITFYFVGPAYQAIVMPLDDPPDIFPNASHTLAIGCPGDGVYALVLYKTPEQPVTLLTASPAPVTLKCPLEYPLGD